MNARIGDASSVGAGDAVSVRRSAVRVGAWAGIVYALAWIVGLFLAPSAPDAFASSATINRYFVGHNSAALTQSLVVHGLAGLALVVFVIGVSKYLRLAGGSDGMTNVALGAGLAAALVSFVQVGLAIALFVHVDDDQDAGGTRSLFNAINKADTVKLVLLAIFIGATCLAARGVRILAPWIRWVGAISVLFLVVGAFAFLIDSNALNTALVLSLPLLLLWSVATSITMMQQRVVSGVLV